MAVFGGWEVSHERGNPVQELTLADLGMWTLVTPALRARPPGLLPSYQPSSPSSVLLWSLELSDTTI